MGCRDVCGAWVGDAVGVRREGRHQVCREDEVAAQRGKLGVKGSFRRFTQ